MCLTAINVKVPAQPDSQESTCPDARNDLGGLVAGKWQGKAGVPTLPPEETGPLSCPHVALGAQGCLVGHSSP